MPTVLTTCPYCGCGCGLYLRADADRLVGVSPSEHNHVSGGRLCLRGWHAHEASGGARLTRPLVRTAGQLKPASWEAALEAAAAGLTRAAANPTELGVLGSARLTNEEDYLLGRLARAALRTNNVDNAARLDHWAAMQGMIATLGASGLVGEFADIEHADLILIWDGELDESHPQVASMTLRALARGARVIVVSPAMTRLSRLATTHLQPGPHSNGAWVNALLNVVINEGLVDEDFIAAHCLNFASLTSLANAFSPAVAEELTGIPADRLIECARAFAAAQRPAVLFVAGPGAAPSALGGTAGLVSLAAITGKLAGWPEGSPGGAVLGLLTSQCNLQGAGDMGLLPQYLPGYQPVDDKAARARFSSVWQRDLPDWRGASAGEMLGKVKALLVVGDDPVATLPDTAAAQAAFEGLDFLVVADAFATETAARADVVLPVAAPAESDGTYTSAERRVQRVRPARPPLGEARPGWQAICDLAARLDYELDFAGPGEVMAEIAMVTALYRDIAYASLERGRGPQWAWSVGADGTQATGPRPQLKIRLGCGESPRPPAITDDEFPLLLVVNPVAGWDNSPLVRTAPTLHREYSAVLRDNPQGKILMRPADAQEAGVRPGTAVRLRSSRGEVVVRLAADPDLPTRTLLVPYALRQHVAAVLGPAEVDSATGVPNYRPVAVSVRKA